MITVFTPTYNRKDKIVNLYKSLKKQKYIDFEWLIVDDGSTDNTKELIDKFINEKEINVRYYYQKNSGKHIAFNTGIEHAKGDLFVCVDSDDFLSNDALSSINLLYEKYKNNKNICGFVFLRGKNLNSPITNYFEFEETVGNYNDYIINNGIKGDLCEVFITNILKQYAFPKFEGEKFLAEGFLWSLIGEKYNYVFLNKIIYLCNYLEGGLTKSGRRLRINNPLGGKEHAKEYIKKIFRFKIRFKNMILYLVYSFFSKTDSNTSFVFLKCICLLPSFILYLYWKYKYR